MLWRSRLLVPVILVSVLLLGFRGVGREDIDVFSMSPVGTQILDCVIHANNEKRNVPLPAQSYIAMSGSILRFNYMELMPLYAAGLKEMLQEQGTDATVSILCQSRHGYPTTFYSARQ